MRDVIISPFKKKKHNGTNVYMREKPKVKLPKQAFISIDVDEGIFKDGG